MRLIDARKFLNNLSGMLKSMEEILEIGEI